MQSIDLMLLRTLVSLVEGVVREDAEAERDRQSARAMARGTRPPERHLSVVRRSA